MFEQVFIIAEAGSNHNGNLKTAIELVHQAGRAGADAIKFQEFSLYSLFSVKYYKQALRLKDDTWQKEIVANTFKSEWHEIIFKEAKRTGIVYFTTPFSPEFVDIIDEYVPFYKIASCDITFRPLLEKIAEKGKGVFISTGASYIDEIDRAVQILKGYNLPFICIMHCIMLYPAPYSSLNLNFLETLSQRYNLPVGFSDHSSGIDAVLLSIGKGARTIEKHFTLNKNQEGTDHKNSLSPEELSLLVKKIRLCEEMLGTRQRVISEKENRERTYARRGIYAKKNLKKGDRLTLESLSFLRPNISIGAERVTDLLGKIVIKDVLKGMPIDFSMVK